MIGVARHVRLPEGGRVYHQQLQEPEAAAHCQHQEAPAGRQSMGKLFPFKLVIKESNLIKNSPGDGQKKSDVRQVAGRG